MQAIQPPQENIPLMQGDEVPILISQVPDLTRIPLRELEKIDPKVIEEIGAYALGQLKKPLTTIAGSSGS